MNDFLIKLLTLVMIVSSLVTACTFCVIWYERGLEAAWDEFEAFINKAYSDEPRNTNNSKSN